MYILHIKIGKLYEYAYTQIFIYKIILQHYPKANEILHIKIKIFFKEQCNKFLGKIRI